LNIRFESLSVSNFKNHKSLTIEFKDITNISGRNGAGKSSIGEAITWCLYGIDMVGSKLDPTPISEEVPETIAVDLLVILDGVNTLLTRSLVKGKAKYYINDVPKKATEFDKTVESMFDKKLFLSLFNPIYFSSQTKSDQRDLMLRYVSEPLNKEVLSAMSKTGAKHLEPLLKKEKLDDVGERNKDIFKKKDNLVERAAERVITLQEQLDKFLEVHDATQDPEQIKKQIDEIVAKRNSLDDDWNKQRGLAMKRGSTMAAIDGVRTQIENLKELIESHKTQPVLEDCRTCGQRLTEEALEKVHENKKNQLKEHVEHGKQLVAQRKELQAELDALPMAVEVDRRESFELDEQIYPLKAKLEAFKRINQLKEEIEEAAAAKESIRKERNKAQSVVEAVKEFRTKRAELMVQKMDELFTTINVRLFEELKNGELRATFEIEMDGKPYSKLSTAEKIKAGLEVIEVLSKQSDVIAPTFVDNAESILKFTKPSGQLITARVVDQDFSITTESLKEALPSE
jgi:DNA repair exonuclease SbcCD ATPase subunit